ncbi:hypothetical protein BDV32DRAFT_133762 [Aspergillus pseudonomiae]|uniref:Uncharacterized protein n=1 Tax=Aspergillus pseudonomiae TaxID=1506151 RepID=A0A5N6HIH6_9EURO|nr:uncharacterized protein BDV37DRAFT_266316 [Aspergillus pseudonomiae]KAB8253634.1 hypothetical protein BDV32DRAFT_133762 [Aspergillus pseudonomiae]KAE8397183.1 hypothetical protein BDV37DRAFT_266316 [Aspergillus pseudonomiae]
MISCFRFYPGMNEPHRTPLLQRPYCQAMSTYALWYTLYVTTFGIVSGHTRFPRRYSAPATGGTAMVNDMFLAKSTSLRFILGALSAVWPRRLELLRDITSQRQLLPREC